MSDPSPAVPAGDLVIRETRTIRRIGRLFRLERAGRFERRPMETIRRLIARRGRLVEELTEMETRRRLLGGPLPPELGAALDELANEVGATRQSCEARIDGLDAELRRRRGEGTATGLRGGGGLLLGRG